MFISTEKEQISLPSETVRESLNSLSPVGSNSHSLDGLPPVSELSDSPPLSSIYTDVNIVPEHEKDELEQSILNLEGEIARLKANVKQLDEKRREALNKILDIKGSIRVFCRVRPFPLTERRNACEHILLESEKIVVRSAGIRKEFEFDKVFSHEASQDEIFIEVEPILKSALDGHNVCILAYGQTGTGKTFTMDGKIEQPGIVPRALKELFRSISLDGASDITFSMSMLEVYMGSLRDLLAPKPASRAFQPVTRSNLNIQTDPKGLVEIEGLTEVAITDFAKARWWYNKGKRVRSTSWTNVNETSSRSHCLTRITIYRRGDGSKAKKEVSKLWMVDLGGSERLLKTGATGLTLDEGRAINLSLSALGDVIAALRRKRGHVPYRNSKLTQILKDSLGDGSKVWMLVHLSPCDEDVGETICSLSFAKRARGIESSRELPDDLKKQREKKIAELEEDTRKAEEECQKLRNQIRNAELLLNENKNHYTRTHQKVDNPEMIPVSRKEDLEEVITSPRKPEKPTRRKNGSNSLPHFMTSTAASRQRHNAAEREIVGREKILRIGTRSSIQFRSSHSQSISYSDIRIRAVIQNSNRKSRYAETNKIATESPKCNDSYSKTDTVSRTNKMVTSSDPNLGTTLCRHRRRMSDLI